MAGALAFDTHRFVKRLVEHGFTQEQAEVLSEEQVQLLNSNLVTKTDFEIGLKNLETSIKDLEIRLIKWMITGFVAQGGLIVALVKLL